MKFTVKFYVLLLCSDSWQGEVTPIDSVLTPATAVKNVDLNLGPWPLDRHSNIDRIEGVVSCFDEILYPVDLYCAWPLTFSNLRCVFDRLTFQPRSRPGQFWNEVGRMKTFDGELRFPSLVKLMVGLLLIPSSNADSERGFSMLRKIHTDQRPTLKQSTIISLMSIKFNAEECCHDSVFNEDLLMNHHHHYHHYHHHLHPKQTVIIIIIIIIYILNKQSSSSLSSLSSSSTS